jgi:valyl-tRNA synthetase
MIFSSLEFIKKIPFEEVYIHATILTLEGRRMSKSLGTGVDPLELINKYGADATRFGLTYQTNRDQQAIRFDERTLKASRNFVNKLWNIARFISMTTDYRLSTTKKLEPKTLADKWILSRLNSLIDSVTKKVANYELGEAAQEIYEFTWHEFADWYLEISKIEGNKDKILLYILNTLLKLLHPFIPFVTEQIYSKSTPGRKSDDLLMIQKWPGADKKLVDKKIEQEFSKIKNLIVEIRNWKAKQGTPLREVAEYKIGTENKKILAQTEQKNLIEKLAKVELIS